MEKKENNCDSSCLPLKKARKRYKDFLLWTRLIRSSSVRAAALLSLTTLAGCDPAFVLRGRIMDADGEPVVDARVRINCSGDIQAETSTGADGRFLGHDIGWYPESCVIEAFPATEDAPITWPMMPSCTRPRASRACLEVTADLRLP